MPGMGQPRQNSLGLVAQETIERGPRFRASKIKCPDCGDVTELYDYLIDKILQAPEPGVPSVEVLSISSRDPNGIKVANGPFQIHA
jgi:hypothetical protein